MARGSEEFLGRLVDVIRRSGVSDAEELISRVEHMARCEHQIAIDAAVRETQVFAHYCSHTEHEISKGRA